MKFTIRRKTRTRLHPDRGPDKAAPEVRKPKNSQRPAIYRAEGIRESGLQLRHADESDESRTDNERPEDEGGPVKSFLEHLEDLRWVLIKSFTALLVAFVVCLVAGNVVISVLLIRCTKLTSGIPSKSK